MNTSKSDATLTRTFTFEGATCTIRRLKVRDALERDKFRAAIGDQPYAGSFVDFIMQTVEFKTEGASTGSTFQKPTDPQDIPGLEAAYERFLDLDEAFVVMWQNEQRALMRPAIKSENGEKKALP